MKWQYSDGPSWLILAPILIGATDAIIRKRLIGALRA